MTLSYGSVCSGIEAASVAWGPLGMRPVWFAEVDKFPSEVLAQRWPKVHNLGDMCNLADYIDKGYIEAPDILIGGTPCQSFSVAGKRAGLNDDRGKLTLEFVRLSDAIDGKRPGNPAVIVWENVPGVLSSKDNAFGCFIGAISGAGCELEPTGKRWGNAGCVFGPKRTVTWRVLDAQYFRVAQRRRRVFVVASARKQLNTPEVLFEWQSMRRDTAPRRQKATSVAALTAPGVGTCGADDNQAQAGHIMSHGQGGAEVSHERCPTLTCNHEAPIYVKPKGLGCDSELMATPEAPNGGKPGQRAPMVVHPINDKATRHAGKTGKGSGNGFGVGTEYDPSPTLTAGDKHAVSINARQDPIHANEHTPPLDTKGNTNAVSTQSGIIRRLTPTECERLQGFPDNHTQINWRGKQVIDCPDGPRYKAVGNSMAVPVVYWIGARILSYWQ